LSDCFFVIKQKLNFSNEKLFIGRSNEVKAIYLRLVWIRL
jgi:hypothetical protein